MPSRSKYLMIGLVYRWSGSASMFGLGIDGSMLNQNRVIANDVKSCDYCYYIRYTTLIVRWNALAPNSLPCTVRSSRQKSYNQRVGCLLYSMARIFDIWNGSLDKRNVCGLVPYCCQEMSDISVWYQEYLQCYEK